MSTHENELATGRDTGHARESAMAEAWEAHRGTHYPYAQVAFEDGWHAALAARPADEDTREAFTQALKVALAWDWTAEPGVPAPEDVLTPVVSDLVALFNIGRRVTADGQANDCSHLSATGVDRAPIGPGKVWRCDHCSLTWTEGPRRCGACRDLGGDHIERGDCRFTVTRAGQPTDDPCASACQYAVEAGDRYVAPPCMFHNDWMRHHAGQPTDDRDAATLETEAGRHYAAFIGASIERDEARRALAAVRALVDAYEVAPEDADYRFLGDDLADALRAALDGDAATPDTDRDRS